MDEVWVCSDIDASRIKSLNYKRQVRVVPNFYTYPIKSARPPKADQSAHCVLFVGSMRYHPNIDGVSWFLKNSWPAILKEVPDAECLIVGPWGENRTPAEEFSLPGVKIAGFIENLEESYAQADVFISPLRIGSGTRIKILEAWSYGLPVVSTTVGIEGILHVRGKDALIGDTPQEFTDAVVQLLLSPALQKDFGESGYQNGKAHYDHRHISAKVREYCRELISGKGD